MKYLLILTLKIYQICYPQSWKRTCIFKESCSNYVLRVTREKGFIEGMIALKYRIQNCRPGYYIVKIEGKMYLISSNSQAVEEKLINIVIMQAHIDENIKVIDKNTET